MDKEQIIKAFQFRHACKEFDSEKKIANEDLRFILETGRLSPSSFGLEQWKFLVIQKDEDKSKLQKACFEQKQLTTCSDVVVVLGKIGLYHAGSEYVSKMFKRWGFPDDIYNFMLNFHSSMVKEMDLTQWSVEQCHIAAANMMTAAALIGIDSCPIGGFQPEQVKEILALDSEKFIPTLILTFGYRKNEQPPKIRLAFDEVVEFF
ncbi:NAD(P)H-dependent oxidoreductase [Candidatus Riflebacteria bacterium]